MKKIYIYPFSYKQLPLMRVNEMQESIELVPSLPKSLYRSDKYLNYLVNGVGVPTINNSIEIDSMIKNINNNDKYIFCNSDGKFHSLNYGLEISERINNLGYEPFNYLSHSTIQKIKSLNNVLYSKVNLNEVSHSVEKLNNLKSNKPKLKKINKEIISVSSIIDDYGKTGLCLDLYDYYKSRNKNPICILSDPLFELIGMKYIDYDELILKSINTAILYINEYVYNLSKEYDTIIIEVPYNLIRYNDEKIDSSGVFAYLLSEALNINKTICCITANRNDKPYYDALNDIFNRKFGYSDISYFMTNFYPCFPNRLYENELPGVFINKTEYKDLLIEQVDKNINLYNEIDSLFK